MSTVSEVTWAICVDYHDGSGVETGCFSSGMGWRTLPTDTPANQEFQPRILRPPLFERTVYGNRSTYGRGDVAVGEIVLANADGALTDWVGYGFGRRIDIYVGDEGAAFPSQWTHFLSGHVKLAALRGTELVLELRDLREQLTRPIQTTLFAGDNVLPDGFEGTEDDLRGYPKPLCYGRCYNVPAINVNTARHIYQVNDGPVQSIDYVMDMGAPFTFDANYADSASLAAASVSEGHYATCLAEGYFKLGSIPAGEVTADVYGDAGGGYVETVAEIVERILTTRAGFSGGDLDSGSFAALVSAAPEPVGLWIADEMMMDEAIDMLLASVGAWLLPTRLGVWEVGRRDAPSGSPVATIYDADMLAGEWVLANDEGEGLPAWRVLARWGRNWAPLSQIAGVVSEAEQAWLKKEWRETAAADIAALIQYPDAYSLEMDTLLANAADADAEALRELTLRSTHRDHLQLDVALAGDIAGIDLGAVVEVNSPRLLGASSPKLMRVMGVGTSGRRGRFTLTLWG